MAKLCYKVGGTVKKYDLKDSVSSSPKLGIKINGSTKYVKLARTEKSEGLNVKYNGYIYQVQTLKEASEITPTKAVSLRMTRYYDANGYDWTTDSENNTALCEEYGVSGRAYKPNGWGGYGPFRMYAAGNNGEPLPERTYTRTVTYPFYFLWEDNADLNIGGYGKSWYPWIYVLDVRKNDTALKQYQGTNTPILFEVGDTFGAIIMFQGYNTSDGPSSSNIYRYFKFTPYVRYADEVNPADLTA